MQYGIPEIDVATLAAWREAGRPFRLVDVRTAPEVAQGVIPGAVHLPLHLLPLRFRELEGEGPLIVYCRTGARSAQAVMWLAGQGWRDAFNLSGGIVAWARAGQPLHPPQPVRAAG